jgi:hypothetical protein
MAIGAGVCEKEYGNRLLSIITKAIQAEPTEKADFSDIATNAEKARSDKKNTDDGLINMAVAKRKNEWTTFALPFEEYRRSLVEIAGQSKR